VAGHFQLLFVDIGPSLELVRAGKAVALGISSAEAFPTAPEIRPLNTVGLPGFDTTAWQMLVAPAGTPRPILEKLNAEGNAAVKSPDVEKRLNDLGMTALGKGSLEELEKFVKSETGRWGKVIREAGLAGSQ
jgi:tripartite-type tricarboxylate transporter receptor subunit TctC